MDLENAVKGNVEQSTAKLRVPDSIPAVTCAKMLFCSFEFKQSIDFNWNGLNFVWTRPSEEYAISVVRIPLIRWVRQAGDQFYQCDASQPHTVDNKHSSWSKLRGHQFLCLYRRHMLIGSMKWEYQMQSTLSFSVRCLQRGANAYEQIRADQPCDMGIANATESG